MRIWEKRARRVLRTRAWGLAWSQWMRMRVSQCTCEREPEAVFRKYIWSSLPKDEWTSSDGSDWFDHLILRGDAGCWTLSSSSPRNTTKADEQTELVVAATKQKYQRTRTTKHGKGETRGALVAPLDEAAWGCSTILLLTFSKQCVCCEKYERVCRGKKERIVVRFDLKSGNVMVGLLHDSRFMPHRTCKPLGV
jgi:hypothetical protein